MDYKDFVTSRLKDPFDVYESFTPNRAQLIHMTLGIAGEVGEIIDTIKKHTMYDQELHVENLVEELGDLEFYLEGLRQTLELSREEILRLNQKKLSKRYPSGYSDSDAAERKDKQ